MVGFVLGFLLGLAASIGTVAIVAIAVDAAYRSEEWR